MRIAILMGSPNRKGSTSILVEHFVKGAQEAVKKLCDIQFSHVFSSPLKRAIQTAEIIAPGMEAKIDERLIEMDYGPYEGADRNGGGFYKTWTLRR